MQRLFLALILPLFLFAMSDKELATAINLAGKQRMLTQKMSKDALMIFKGVDVKNSQKELKESYTLFDKTLKGLLNGDKSLNLVPSNNKKIEDKLKEVEKLWKPFLVKIKEVESFKNLTDKTFEYIDKNNLPLLKKMNEAVTLYTKLGDSKTSKLKMANDINLAGKLRMLTQRVAKDVLLYQLDLNPKEALKDLDSSVELFDKILNGLYNGDKELKLEGTKLPKIIKQLNIAKESWQKTKPLIAEAIKDKNNLKLTDELIRKLDKVKYEVNIAVGLYEKSLNRQKQVLKLNALIDGFMTKKSNSKHLINLAGKQRMLTQRVSKLAIECGFSLRANSCEMMEKYMNLYAKTLKGFKDGDNELNLEATKSKVAKDEIAKINTILKPFKESISKLKNSNGKDKEALKYILAHNIELLKESNNLVSIFEKESNKNISYIEKAQLKIVNVAGRQRMLTQKMTKEYLEYLELHNNKSKTNMAKTKELFSKSLDALINGNKEMGLPKVTNSKIKEQLSTVSNLWSKIMTIYNKNSLNSKEMLLLLKVNPILLKEMNRAVKIIEESTDY